MKPNNLTFINTYSYGERNEVVDFIIDEHYLKLSHRKIFQLCNH